MFRTRDNSTVRSTKIEASEKKIVFKTEDTEAKDITDSVQASVADSSVGAAEFGSPLTVHNENKEKRDSVAGGTNVDRIESLTPKSRNAADTISKISKPSNSTKSASSDNILETSTRQPVVGKNNSSIEKKGLTGNVEVAGGRKIGEPGVEHAQMKGDSELQLAVK